MNIGLFCFLLSLSVPVWANTALDELTALETQKHEAMAPRSQSAPLINANDSFTQHHVLLVFFSSTCHFCQAFVPVVHQWSVQHHWSVVAVTTNGEALPDFPQPEPMNAELKARFFAGKPVVVPACFVLNNQTGKAFPVSMGALNTQEFDERMNILLPKIAAYEKGGQV
jgi:type-F conjugative transfer system pilin assembly thiol-disulfide isomerase TrbB